MRKEVKLGMTIGGGLIALLVVYMLVAPPNQNKAGAQLATGDKGGNIIDPAQTTDSTTVSDDKTVSHTTTDTAGGLPRRARGQRQKVLIISASATSPCSSSHRAARRWISNGAPGSCDSSWDSANSANRG